MFLFVYTKQLKDETYSTLYLELVGSGFKRLLQCIRVCTLVRLFAQVIDGHFCVQS